MRQVVIPLALLIAGVALQRWQGADFTPWLWPWCRLGFTMIFLLAWRLRRGRIAWTMAALAVTAEAMVAGSLGSASGVPAEASRIGLILLLPMVLAVAAWSKDWWVWSRSGALRFGLLGIAFGAVFWLASPGGQPVRQLLEGVRLIDPLWLPERLPEWLPERLPGSSPAEGGGGNERSQAEGWRQALLDFDIPQLGIACFFIAATAMGIALGRRRAPLESGLLAALIALFLAFEITGQELYFLCLAAVILCVALVERAFALAFEDGLTGLPARRALEENLLQLGRTYAIAMVDLDHFKKFNDRHGHEVGDQVLRMVASRLAKVRGGGSAYRYGGEEFTVIFPGKTVAEAMPDLEDLRRAVADEAFQVRSLTRPRKKPKASPAPKMVVKRLKVTVSIGVAERSAKSTTPEMVIKAADRALYRAKKAGRNRVTFGR